MIDIENSAAMAEYLASVSTEPIRFPTSSNVWLEQGELALDQLQAAQEAAQVAGRSLHLR